MIAYDDGWFGEVFLVWIADGEPHARYSVPQRNEPREVPKQFVHTHSLLFQVFGESQIKHCSWRNYEEDGQDEEQKSVGSSQERH